MEDAGRYTCVATNAAGEAQQHLRLHVHGNAIPTPEKTVFAAFSFNMVGLSTAMPP